MNCFLTRQNPNPNGVIVDCDAQNNFCLVSTKESQFSGGELIGYKWKSVKK